METGDISFLNDILVESCQTAFGSVGVALHRVDTDPDFACEGPVTAIVGIGGAELRATITIVGPFSFMCRAYPLDLRRHADAALDVLDWAGEVANQVVGRMTNGLGDLGLDVSSGLPKVILTEHLSNVSPPGGNVSTLRFSAQAGSLAVWLEAVSPTGERLGTSTANRYPPFEGLVLFDEVNFP